MQGSLSGIRLGWKKASLNKGSSVVGPAGVVIMSMELLTGSSFSSSQSMVLSRMDASIPAIEVYARQLSAAKQTVVCLSKRGFS